jgi:predicted PurR-regulated permease PerM
MAQAKKPTADQFLRKAEESSRNGDVPFDRDPWMRASQMAVIGLFIMALVWAAHASQPVLVPVLLAWVIATIVHPIVDLMRAYKVPRVLACVLVTMALMAIVISLLALLSMPITYWLGRATELSILIKEKLQTINQPLVFLGEIRKALGAVSGGEPALQVAQSGNVVTTLFGILTPAVSQFILFAGALLFYLVYRERIKNTAVLLFTNRPARLTALRTLNDID